MELAAFATKAKVDVRPDHLDMAVSQGGQSERAVLLSVLVVADADSGLLEEPNDRRQHLLQRHPRPFQVAVGMLAALWQGRCEGQHPIVLDRIPDLAPARVIAILLAPSSITPGRLEMAPRVGADPDVGPRRRNGQAFDSPDRLRVTDGAAFAREVGEALSGALAMEPRAQVRDVAEARRSRRLDRVDQLRGIHRGRRLPRLLNG